MNNTKFSEQISTIINKFDFNQVHEVMKFLNIKFKIDNQQARILSERELKKIAIECLNKVAESNDINSSIGLYGFEADKISDFVELRYVLQRINPLQNLLNPEDVYGVEKKPRN